MFGKIIPIIGQRENNILSKGRHWAHVPVSICFFLCLSCCIWAFPSIELLLFMKDSPSVFQPCTHIVVNSQELLFTATSTLTDHFPSIFPFQSFTCPGAWPHHQYLATSGTSFRSLSTQKPGYSNTFFQFYHVPILLRPSSCFLFYFE